MADDLKGLKKGVAVTASNVGDAIKEIRVETAKLEKELKSINAPLTAWESSFSSISNLSKKILDTQNKSLVSSKGTAEAVKNQKKANQDALALDIKINELLKNKTKYNTDLNNSIDKTVSSLTKAKEQAKILAGAFKDVANASASLDRSTKFFSNVSEAVKEYKGLKILSSPFAAASQAAREQAVKNVEDPSNKKSTFITGAKAGIGDAIGGMKDFLKGPIWITALIEIAKFFKDAMFAASKQIADFQRNLGVSRDSASEIRDRFYEISDSAKILAQTQTGNLILQKDLVEAQESFNTSLGLAVDLSTKQNEGFAAQFTNIKKFYNLNEQEQKGLVNLSATNNETLDETKNSILGQAALYRINTKEAINIRKVFKEVLTTSNATKLSIKGGGDALVKSVINAQKLGVTLDSLGKIADNLLNFEESISSELEAELILGRDLELEKARAAALMNDQVTLTEEVNRLVKDAGPDFEKNRIAMQASAKAIGIGVDELADMVTQQRVVEKFKQNFQALDEKAIENSKTLSKDEKKRLKENKGTAEDYYKFAKEQGKDLVEILGDEQASRMEAQDAQQKFNDALEKAKETFASFVDGGALDKFADFLVKFVESVGIQGFATTLFTGLADDTDIAEAKVEKKQEEISMESDPVKKKQLQDDLAKLQIEKDQVGYETEKKRILSTRESLVKQGYGTEQADRELYQLEQNKPTKLAAGGIITKPIYNATVGEAGPEAVIPLNKLPEMFDMGRAYGTNNTNNTTNNITNTTNTTNDMNKIVALLTQQNILLTSIYNKEGTIVLNGTKMGTGMNVGGYKTA
jgi:hypothetical protein